MKIIRLLSLILIVGLVLVVAAFGSNGLKSLFTSQVNSVQAAPSLPNSSSAPVVTTVNYVPAPEIPARAPDTLGFVTSRDGNILNLQNSITGGVDMFGTGPSSGVVVSAGSGSAISSSGVIVAGSEPSLTFGGQVQPGSSVGQDDKQTIIVTGQDKTVTSSSAPASSDSMSGISVVASSSSPTDMTDMQLPERVAPQQVVVTDATKIYRDSTPRVDPAVNGSQTIHQTLEAGTLDALKEQVMVTVWGHMDNNQLVADVIVYQEFFVTK